MPEALPESGTLGLPEGSVSWWRRGDSRRPLFLCAHGAGAPSASAFMQALGAGLDARGITVVHFDFPHMTRAARSGRRLPPDRPAVLLAACGAVLDLVRTWQARDAAPTRCVVGGKSMGGRMWSMLLAATPVPEVAAALYLGYPLHPAGRPERLRAAHLQEIAIPQLFLSGSRDPLARLDLLREVVDTLPHARLHVVDGGDHSLATARHTPGAGSDLWLDAAAQFIHAHAPG